MGAISNHYGDIATWIDNVIESCETIKQSNTVSKLLRNFENRLISEFPDSYWPNYYYDVIQPLKIQLDYKKDEILKKQLS